MIKKMFLPFFLCFALILGFAMPVSASENDWCEAMVMQDQIIELQLSSEYEGYYVGSFDQSIIDASFYSWYSSYVPYDSSNPDVYYYDFLDAVDFVLIVDGVAYSGFINLVCFYCYVGNEDSLFYDSSFSPSEAPCTFELCFDDYSEPSAFSSYTEGYVFFPSSYFDDPSAETQTVTISAYVGTLPPTVADSALENVFSLFTGVIAWFVTSFAALDGIFWNKETGLTLVGILSVIGVAIGVTLAIVRWVKDIVRLR